jgi:hypothetical protein
MGRLKQEEKTKEAPKAEAEAVTLPGKTEGSAGDTKTSAAEGSAGGKGTAPPQLGEGEGQPRGRWAACQVEPLGRAQSAVFQSALSRAKKGGTEKDQRFLAAWQSCSTLEEKRKFQQSWSLDKELAICQVQESTSTQSSTASKSIKGEFTQYVIANHLKVPLDSPVMQRIRSQPSKVNPEYPDLPDMVLYYFEHNLGETVKFKDHKEVKSVATAEVTPEEAQHFEKSLRPATTTGLSLTPAVKPKAKPKPKAAPELPPWIKPWEEQVKKSKALDKQVGSFLLQVGADLHKLSQKPKGALVKATFEDLTKCKEKIAKAEKDFKTKLEAGLNQPCSEDESAQQVEVLKVAQKEMEKNLKEAKKSAAVAHQVLQA